MSSMIISLVSFDSSTSGPRQIISDIIRQPNDYPLVNKSTRAPSTEMLERSIKQTVSDQIVDVIYSIISNMITVSDIIDRELLLFRYKSDVIDYEKEYIVLSNLEIALYMRYMAFVQEYDRAVDTYAQLLIDFDETRETFQRKLYQIVFDKDPFQVLTIDDLVYDDWYEEALSDHLNWRGLTIDPTVYYETPTKEDVLYLIDTRDNRKK